MHVKRGQTCHIRDSVALWGHGGGSHNSDEMIWTQGITTWILVTFKNLSPCFAKGSKNIV